MELAGKIVVHLELSSSSDDFFKAWSREAHKIPGKATNQIKQVDLHEGDWEGTGSIKQWVYTIDGKEEIFKEKVHIDDENKTVTMYCVEGHCLELYKTYSLVFAFGPKLLTLTVEYEKIKAETPRPNHYVDMIIGFMRDIDAHLVKH